MPSANTLNGTPLMTLIMLLICQPPRMSDATLFSLSQRRPGPSGSCQTLVMPEVVRPIAAGERSIAVHVRAAAWTFGVPELFSLGLIAFAHV